MLRIRSSAAGTLNTLLSATPVPDSSAVDLQLLHHFRDVAMADRKEFANTLLGEQRTDESKLDSVLQQLKHNRLEAGPRTKELEVVVRQIKEFLVELPDDDSQAARDTDELLKEALADLTASRQLAMDDSEIDRVATQLKATQAQTERLEKLLDAWGQRDSELQQLLAGVYTEQQTKVQEFEQVRRLEATRIQATIKQSSDTEALKELDEELRAVRMRQVALLAQRDSGEAAPPVDIEALLIALNERETRLITESLSATRQLQETPDSGASNSAELDTLRRQLGDITQQLESLSTERSENDLQVMTLLMSELAPDKEYLHVRILQQLLGTKEESYQRVWQQVRALPQTELSGEGELLASLERIDQERRQLAALAIDLQVDNSIQAGVRVLKDEIVATREAAPAGNILTRAQDLDVKIQELDVKLLALRKATEAWRSQNLVTLTMDARQPLPIKLDTDMHVKQNTGGEWASVEGMQLVAVNGQMTQSVDGLAKALQMGSGRLSFAPSVAAAKRLIGETATLAQSKDQLRLAIEALRTDSADLDESADEAGRLEQVLQNIKVKYAEVDDGLNQIPWDVAQSQQELVVRLDQKNQGLQQNVTSCEEKLKGLKATLSVAEQHEGMILGRLEVGRALEQTLESDASELVTREALVHDQLQDITTESSILAKELTKQAKVVRELDASKQAQQNEVRELSAKLTIAEQHSQLAIKQLQVLQDESDRREDKHRQLLVVHKETENSVGELERQKKEVEKKLEEASAELETLKDEQQRLNQADEEQRPLVERVEANNASEQQLEHEMRAALRAELLGSGLDEAVAEMSAKVEAMQQERDKLSAENTEIREAYDNSTELLKRVVSAMKASDAVGTSLAAEMQQAAVPEQDNLNEELANAETKVREEEQQRQLAVANYEILLLSTKELEHKHTRLSDELRTFGQEKSALLTTRAATKKLNEELEQTRAEKKSLEGEIATTAGELEKTKQDLIVCAETQTTLQREQSELRSSYLPEMQAFRKALHAVQKLYEPADAPEPAIQDDDDIKQVISSLTLELNSLSKTVQKEKKGYMTDLAERAEMVKKQHAELEKLKKTTSEQEKELELITKEVPNIEALLKSKKNRPAAAVEKEPAISEKTAEL